MKSGADFELNGEVCLQGLMELLVRGANDQDSTLALARLPSLPQRPRRPIERGAAREGLVSHSPGPGQSSYQSIFFLYFPAEAVRFGFLNRANSEATFY